MLIIAEPYARFSTALETSQIPLAARRLLELAEARVPEIYARSGYTLELRAFVRVETGSTRIWIAIKTAAAALVFYGTIRQSIDYLNNDARRVANALLPDAPATMGLNEPPAVQLRKRGIPGKLRYLFRLVERHQLSPEEATKRAVDFLWEVDGPEITQQVPDLAERLAEELREAAQLGTRSDPDRRPDSPRAPRHALPARRPTGVIVGRDEQTGELVLSTY